MQEPTYLKSVDSAAVLGMELVALGKVIRRELSRKAAQLGISDGEWGILVHLRRTGGGISQQNLAGYLGNEPHAVVRVLANMEKSGTVTRLVDPSDARGRLVSLTPDGHALADQFLQITDQYEHHLVRGISITEITQVVDTLRKMRRGLLKE